MPDRDEMLRLAAACEAASGPDRELDRGIRVAVFGSATSGCYTASLDAAIALVPAGCLFTTRTVWDNGNQAGLGFVSRYEKGEFCGHERLYWMDEHQSVAATPALALTAACLRAHAAMGE